MREMLKRQNEADRNRQVITGQTPEASSKTRKLQSNAMAKYLGDMWQEE